MTATNDITASSPTRHNILVVGATGGTGRATIERLVQDGHRVTAFSRHADCGPKLDLDQFQIAGSPRS